MSRDCNKLYFAMCKSAITSTDLRGGAGPGGVGRQRSNYRIITDYNSAVSHHVQASSNRKMTTFTAWVYVFFVLCASIVKATSPAVDIEPKRETVVRLNQELKILCKIENARPLRACRVEIPGINGAMVLSKGDVEGEVEYYGDGTNTGQCGIRINRVQRIHNGIFKCFLTPDNSRQEATASVEIIVAEAPKEDDVTLLLSRSKDRGIPGYYKKADLLQISCKVSNGRPAANVSLYLDDELLINDEKTTVSNQNNNFDSMRNASRVLDWTDHGKKIRCVVNHIGLNQSLEKEWTLSVEYPPQPQKSFERFGYVIGRQGVINVTVYANPMPSFKWNISGESVDAGVPDKSQRFQTSSPVELRSGVWSVILTINNVEKSDTEKDYRLLARNNEGTYEYQIILSTSSEPAVELDAGSIIGIVVGVLILVLIIFLLIFARATGRWCFAARRRGDSEETAGDIGVDSEAHITPGDEDDEDHEDPHIIDEKIPHGGQENPIHTSNEYVNGRTDVKDVKKDEKTDTPV